jgi:hypothetical protein
LEQLPQRPARAQADKATNRPFTFENPVEPVRKFTARQVREDQNATPKTTTPEEAARLFSAFGPDMENRKAIILTIPEGEADERRKLFSKPFENLTFFH